MDRIRDDQTLVIERNQNMVYRLARAGTGNPHDVDDVFQEVFLRYIRKKPVFESPEHERNWFLRVTVNCTHTMMTSFWKNRTEELSEDLAVDFDDLPVDAEDLRSALENLDRRYRVVLHLFYYEELSAREIADALRLRESNVRMLLTRARRALKTILEKENAI